MIKIEGKISQTNISILIDIQPSLSYTSLQKLEKCKLLREKHECWLVQLAMGNKRK